MSNNTVNKFDTDEIRRVAKRLLDRTGELEQTKNNALKALTSIKENVIGDDEIPEILESFINAISSNVTAANDLFNQTSQFMTEQANIYDGILEKSVDNLENVNIVK